MQSSAKTVTAYFKKVPAERKAALKKLRDLCRLTFPNPSGLIVMGESMLRAIVESTGVFVEED
jgi:hypothetical protein